ncbi:Transposase IS30-like HTH domain containing protein [uncultured Caudovirales phage]|uniref:Transposase IS30-like HTH domain containing protein n=1 Tax=uncultured Caudovirales phage TaxID=2100421 RepID=A0A6J5S4P3_9CAUD|nr:Transposase IS30-like HTH domain containing protein [uncultured Caudovirales phage]
MSRKQANVKAALAALADGQHEDDLRPATPVPRSELSEDERERILSLHRLGYSRAKIAKALGRGAGSVDRTIMAAAPSDPTILVGQSNASRTQAALAGRRRHNEERNNNIADLAGRVVEKAFGDVFADEVTVYNFGGSDNEYNEATLKAQPTKAISELAKAGKDAADVLLKIQAAQAKTDEGNNAVDAWLDWVTGEGVPEDAEPCIACSGTGVLEAHAHDGGTADAG